MIDFILDMVFTVVDIVADFWINKIVARFHKKKQQQEESIVENESEKGGTNL